MLFQALLAFSGRNFYFLCCFASYVGDMFEKPDQEQPDLDCKGIEVVRRDQCPLVVKTYESVLRILFRKRDLSAVKRYVVKIWKKILEDRLPLSDFVFAKEVKFGSYARENTLPPAAVVATRAMLEVQYDMLLAHYYVELWIVLVLCFAFISDSLLRESVLCLPYEIMFYNIMLDDVVIYILRRT